MTALTTRTVVLARPTLVIGLGAVGARTLRYVQWIAGAQGEDELRAALDGECRLLAIDCMPAEGPVQPPPAILEWRRSTGASPAAPWLPPLAATLVISPTEAVARQRAIRQRITSNGIDTGPMPPGQRHHLERIAAQSDAEVAGAVRDGRIIDRHAAWAAFASIRPQFSRILIAESRPLIAGAQFRRPQVIVIGDLSDPFTSGILGGVGLDIRRAVSGASIIGLLLVPPPATAATHQTWHRSVDDGWAALEELGALDPGNRDGEDGALASPDDGPLFTTVHLCAATGDGEDMTAYRLAQAALAAPWGSVALDLAVGAHRFFTSASGLFPMRGDARERAALTQCAVALAATAVKPEQFFAHSDPPVSPLAQWVEAVAKRSGESLTIHNWIAGLQGIDDATLQHIGTGYAALRPLNELYRERTPAPLLRWWEDEGDIWRDPAAIALDIVGSELEGEWQDRLARMGALAERLDQGLTRLAADDRQWLAGEMNWLERIPSVDAAEVAADLAPLRGLTPFSHLVPDELPVWGRLVLRVTVGSRDLPREFAAWRDALADGLGRLANPTALMRRAGAIRFITAHADELRALLNRILAHPPVQPIDSARLPKLDDEWGRALALAARHAVSENGPAESLAEWARTLTAGGPLASASHWRNVLTELGRAADSRPAGDAVAATLVRFLAPPSPGRAAAVPDRLLAEAIDVLCGALAALPGMLEWRLGGSQVVRQILTEAGATLLIGRGRNDPSGQVLMWFPAGFAPREQSLGQVLAPIARDVFGPCDVTFDVNGGPAGFRCVASVAPNLLVEPTDDRIGNSLVRRAGLKTPQPKAVCGNPGCTGELAGHPREALFCPHCDGPIRNRCGNRDCTEDDLGARLAGDRPVYVCPACRGDLKTMWWYCPNHATEARSIDDPVCPRCLADYRLGRLAAAEIGRRPDHARHCPGCEAQGLPVAERTVIPNSLAPFVARGIRPGEAKAFAAACAGAGLKTFECINGHHLHYLFPAIPDSDLQSRNHRHLFLHDGVWLPSDGRSALRVREHCFHCNFPIARSASADGATECPRCRRPLRSCAFCSPTDGALMEPVMAFGHGPPDEPFERVMPDFGEPVIERCPRCTNPLAASPVDDPSARLGLVVPGQCTNIYGCRAAATFGRTACERNRGLCAACEVGGRTELIEVGRIGSLIRQCPMCRALAGLTASSPTKKVERATTKSRGKARASTAVGSPISAEALTGPCPLCGTAPEALARITAGSPSLDELATVARVLLNERDVAAIRTTLATGDIPPERLQALLGIMHPASRAARVLRGRMEHIFAPARST